MSAKNIYLLLGAVALLFLISFFVSNQEQKHVEDTQRGKIFLSELDSKINDVAQVEIIQNGQPATLLRKGDEWVLKERFDYPADVAQIKQIVLSLAQLKTVEPKTSAKENYDKLGVQDPGVNSNNKKITLSDSNGKSISSVIVGNGKGNGSYVRKIDDNQAWLVEGNLFFPGAIAGWLDKTIIDIPTSDVTKVSIQNSKREIIELAKLKKDDLDFSIISPKSIKTPNAVAISGVVGGLSRLQFDDVVPRDNIKSANSNTLTRFNISNEVSIIVHVVDSDKKSYLVFDAEPIADVKPRNPQNNGTGDASASNPALQKYNAEKMQEKFKKWAYEVPSFKADSFRKALSDLTQAPVKK